jgi:hypothetical protein
MVEDDNIQVMTNCGHGHPKSFRQQMDYIHFLITEIFFHVRISVYTSWSSFDLSCTITIVRANSISVFGHMFPTRTYFLLKDQNGLFMYFYQKFCNAQFHFNNSIYLLVI